MNKKIYSILLGVISCIGLLFFNHSTTQAAILTVQGNQASEAKIYDSQGKLVPHDEPLSQWTSYNISYSLSVKTSDIHNGDTILVYLPNNVQVKNSIHDVPIYTDTNVQIGTFQINSGSMQGKITITNASVINNTPLDQHINVSFGVYGTRADNTPSADWIINKVAWINQNNHNIVWNVAVNNTSGKNSQIIIHDMPDSNSELVSNNVTVQYGYYENNTFMVTREGALPIKKTSDGFTVNLGDYEEPNAQIVYETKPIKQGFITNKVELVVNGVVTGTNQATIDYDANGNYIGSNIDKVSSSANSVLQSSVIVSSDELSTSSCSSSSSSATSFSKISNSKVTQSSLGQTSSEVSKIKSISSSDIDNTTYKLSSHEGGYYSAYNNSSDEINSSQVLSSSYSKGNSTTIKSSSMSSSKTSIHIPDLGDLNYSGYLLLGISIICILVLLFLLKKRGY